MAKHLLNDPVCRTAKPAEKDYSLKDGSGLSLLIKTTSVKRWLFTYRFEGKQNRLGLGVYPAAAKKEAHQAKQQTKDNQQRKQDGLYILGSFQHAASDWLASLAHTTRATTQTKKTARLERHVFPAIGDKPIKEVRSSDILALLKPLISTMQLETALRVNAEISAIYNFAIVHNRAENNPAQAVAKQIPAAKVTHRAAIIDPIQVGQLLRDIQNYQGTFVVQMAFRLSPLLFQRPGEIRQMEWKDVFLDAKEWRYRVTKMDINHIVPLSQQAIDILQAIKPYTGTGRYVFPSCRTDSRPMSENTIVYALRQMGYDKHTMSAHGFRTTASTLLPIK